MKLKITIKDNTGKETYSDVGEYINFGDIRFLNMFFNLLLGIAFTGLIAAVYIGIPLFLSFGFAAMIATATFKLACVFMVMSLVSAAFIAKVIDVTIRDIKHIDPPPYDPESQENNLRPSTHEIKKRLNREKTGYTARNEFSSMTINEAEISCLTVLPPKSGTNEISFDTKPWIITKFCGAFTRCFSRNNIKTEVRVINPLEEPERLPSYDETKGPNSP